jgi:hypothetical protein
MPCWRSMGHDTHSSQVHIFSRCADANVYGNMDNTGGFLMNFYLIDKTTLSLSANEYI